MTFTCHVALIIANILPVLCPPRKLKKGKILIKFKELFSRRTHTVSPLSTLSSTSISLAHPVITALCETGWSMLCTVTVAKNRGFLTPLVETSPQKSYCSGQDSYQKYLEMTLLEYIQDQFQKLTYYSEFDRDMLMIHCVSLQRLLNESMLHVVHSQLLKFAITLLFMSL